MFLGSTLTSRIANIFSPGSSAPQQQNQNGLGFVDDGLSGGKQPFADISLGAAHLGQDTMASEAVEEEARPPYIHVSFCLPWIARKFG